MGKASIHKELSYAYKTDLWLRRNFKVSLVNLCAKLGYDETIMQIISTDENSKQAMVQLYNNNKALFDSFNADKMSLKRRGANRTWTEYFKQVIAGWAFEDLFVLWLKSNGLEANIQGCDYHRELMVSGVTNTPDIYITRDGVTRKIELIFDYSDYIIEPGFIEKRSPALLVDYNEKAIILDISLKNNLYVLVDTAIEDMKLHLRHHNTTYRPWDKDVNRYFFAENNKIARPLDQMFDELWDCCTDENLNGERGNLVEEIDEDSPPTEYKVGGIRIEDGEAKEPPKKETEKKEESEEKIQPQINENDAAQEQRTEEVPTEDTNESNEEEEPLVESGEEEDDEDYGGELQCDFV